MSIVNLLYVGAGSCLGGMLRYIISKLLNGSTGAFPIGTFAVNILGCLAIGLIYGLISRGMQLSDGMKLFLTVGVCGGFTTFSTFMHEDYLLFSGCELLMAISYAALSIICGIAATYLGYHVANI
jgi:CrcB protein